MRSITPLLTVASLLLAAPASAAKGPAAPQLHSASQPPTRIRIRCHNCQAPTPQQVTGLIRKRMRQWTGQPKLKINVRPATLAGGGATSVNPITCLGGVETSVRSTPKGLHRKLGAWIKGTSKMKVFVVQDHNGKPTIWASQGDTLPAKLARGLKAAGKQVVELTKCEKGRQGLKELAAACIAAPFSRVAAGAIGSWALRTVGDSIKTRRAVRQKAFDATLKWARSKGQKDGSYPSLSETYDVYKVKLRGKHGAVTPESPSVFMKMLRGANL